MAPGAWAGMAVERAVEPEETKVARMAVGAEREVAAKAVGRAAATVEVEGCSLVVKWEKEAAVRAAAEVGVVMGVGEKVVVARAAEAVMVAGVRVAARAGLEEEARKERRHQQIAGCDRPGPHCPCMSP